MLRSLFVVVLGTVVVGCAPQPPGAGGRGTSSGRRADGPKEH
jgi:hypothetical protein